MHICNHFKKVRRTVGSTDAKCADFIGYENGTSTSVQLGIKGHWERFPIKVFEGKLEFEILSQQ